MTRLLLQLTLVIFATPAQAQEHAVAELRATGSQRFAEQDILRASGIERGKRAVPLAEVKDAATTLLGTGVFKEVGYKHSAVPGGMKVEFTVKDADEFVPADFDNIVWVTQPELVAELRKLVPLFNGQLPLQASGSLQADVAAALQAFLNDREIKATVSYAPAGPREGVTEAYVYNADGVEVKIGQFNLAGATSPLLPLLEAATRELLGTHYQRSSVRNFLTHNLIKVYHRRGHLRAEFGTPQVTVASHKDNETSVAITVPVIEGRAYSFAGVRWSGHTVLATADLDGYIQLRKGPMADGVQLALDTVRLRTEYAHRGYMHMHLDLKPEFDEAAGTVRYDAVVHEGKLFGMGKLDIAGLQPTSADRVRQAWRMREGDPYDSEYVNRFFAQFRLPPGVAYVVEQSEGEAADSIDLTLIFCKQDQKCLASSPNQLFIPDTEPRRRR